MIESTDNVEHRSFARARGTQNGHELVIAKRQAYVVERHLRKRLRNVPFANTLELQHGRQPLPRGHTCPLSPAVRIRRVCPTLSPFFAGASEECNEPRQKNERDGAQKKRPQVGPLYGEAYLEKQRTTPRSGARSSPCFTRFLLLAIRNRLVDKLVECCALLGGANGSHDWISYDVAVLIDDIRCREREQI